MSGKAFAKSSQFANEKRNEKRKAKRKAKKKRKAKRKTKRNAADMKLLFVSFVIVWSRSFGIYNELYYEFNTRNGERKNKSDDDLTCKHFLKS